MNERDSKTLAKDQVIRRLLAEGRYVARKDGTIMDTDWRGTGTRRAVPVRCIHDGMVVCNLSTGSTPRQITVTVSRVIALAHLDTPAGLMFAVHKNGDKADCRAENLAWMDAFSAMQTASANGALKIYRGEAHANAKLSDRDVVGIRSALAAGSKHAPLGKKYGVARRTISSIAEGRHRAHG